MNRVSFVQYDGPTSSVKQASISLSAYEPRKPVFWPLDLGFGFKRVHSGHRLSVKATSIHLVFDDFDLDDPLLRFTQIQNFDFLSTLFLCERNKRVGCTMRFR